MGLCRLHRLTATCQKIVAQNSIIDMKIYRKVSKASDCADYQDPIWSGRKSPTRTANRFKSNCICNLYTIRKDGADPHDMCKLTPHAIAKYVLTLVTRSLKRSQPRQQSEAWIRGLTKRSEAKHCLESLRQAHVDSIAP